MPISSRQPTNKPAAGENRNSVSGSSKCVRVAAVQMNSGDVLNENLELAGRLLARAAADDCVLAALPENFPFMGTHAEDRLQLAEEVGDGPIQEFLSIAARDYGLWIVSGSIPLKSPDAERYYGATLVIDSQGRTRNTYQKIHMFDVCVPDRDEQYRESASMLPGDELVVSETPAGCLGLSICYDLRFPELYRKLVDMGAVLLSVPAAFTFATGTAHWHTLLKARAIENLAYVIAPAQYGQHPDGRSTYGHSLIIDPWGRILAEAPQGDCVISAVADPVLPQKLRREFPALNHRVFK
ncbi:MAG: carbon-nitrogen hydrolase family protein [Woeseia sp.]